MTDKKGLEDLIIRISHNDENALSELYFLTKSGIFSFAYSICGNWHTAEDVLHDTFIRIKQYSRNYKQDTNPKAWILTIAKHVSLNRLRSEKHYYYPDTDDYIKGIAEEDKTSVIEDRLLLDEIFKVLNDNEKQIVTLHAVSGMKHKDIANLLDKPYGTVLWTYSNAVKKLKKSIS